MPGETGARARREQNPPGSSRTKPGKGRNTSGRTAPGLAASRPPAAPPFALVLASGQALLLGAVNAAARSSGLRPGMALADARAILPALLTRPAEPAADARALQALALWCGRYGPSLAVDGEDGLWIDITGVAHLYGGEAGLLRDLVRRIAGFGITVRPGLADTLGAASAIARHAPGRSIAGRIAPPGGAEAAIAGLPVDALRLGPDTVRLLRRLGLKRIGQLTAIPRVSLERRFASRDLAEAVLTRLDQALGSRAEPLRPLLPPPAYAARAAFPEPLISGEALETALARLAQTLAADLVRVEKGARRLALTLYRSDGTSAVLRLGLARASASAPHMLRLFREKLAAIDAGYGIDAMLLAARAVQPLRPGQHDLLGGRAGREEGAAELVDRLAGRLGEAWVLRLVPRQSHVPERAEVLVSALAPGIPWPVPPRALPPRPPFLLARPEPIEVLAEVPEGPPQRFRWRRVLHRVVRAEGPERIAPEWWREIGLSSLEAGATPAAEGEAEAAATASEAATRKPEAATSDAPAATSLAASPSPGAADPRLRAGAELPPRPLRPRSPRSHPGAKPAPRGPKSRQPETDPADPPWPRRPTPPAPHASRPRDYYRIEDDTGARYWVFREGLYRDADSDRPPTWYLHGMFG